MKSTEAATNSPYRIDLILGVGLVRPLKPQGLKMRKNTQEYLSKKVVGSVHHPHNTRAVGSRSMEPRHNLRLVADPTPSGC